MLLHHVEDQDVRQPRPLETVPKDGRLCAATEGEMPYRFLDVRYHAVGSCSRVRMNVTECLLLIREP